MRLLVSVLGTALGVIAQASIVKDETGSESILETIAVAICLICLVLLALKIYKNTRVLNKTVDEAPQTGEKWIARHLKELNSDQLDTLLKQNQSSSNSNQAKEN